MSEPSADDPITLDEIVEAVISEDLPRDGQVLPNIEKWILANTLIFGSNSKNEFDPLFDFSARYKHAYSNSVGDELLAFQMLADIQSDIYEAMMRSGVHGEFDFEMLQYRYATTICYYRKLTDKFVALDAGLTEWRHPWLH
jgi:hypothetical protein